MQNACPWWNKAICLSSRNPEVYFSLESVVLNKNKYLLMKDNIQRHLPYLQIQYIQYDTFRTNPDQAAAYVIACAVVHNIGIERRDIMYNIPDVNATPYNPANNYVAVTCRNIAQKYFGKRDMYMQQLSDMHLVMMKLYSWGKFNNFRFLCIFRKRPKGRERERERRNTHFFTNKSCSISLN